ncbi:MAG: hypothetical protein O7H41_14580 [Planctomycetota bacterium]|nr:hypothetical protein [Planctomycetota bacterium]
MSSKRSGLERDAWRIASLSALVFILGCGGGGGSKKKAAADLEATNVSAPVTMTTVTYQVTVSNLGGKAASSFRVDLYYDLASPPAMGAAGDASQTITSLAAGDVQTLTFVRTATPPGSYSSWVQVDTLDVVSESDETNNVRGPTNVNVTLPNVPDLEVVSMSASVTGSTVTYMVTVVNSGNFAAGAFQVDIYYDQGTAPMPAVPGDDSQVVSSLGAAALTTLTFVRSATPAATYSSWAQADTLGAVMESNENNNTAGPVIVTVTAPPSPDLAVSSFSASVVGSDVTYDVEVINLGTGSAGAFDVDLYYDRAAAPGPGTPGDDSQSVASLAGGATMMLTFSLIGAPSGSYLSWLQLDRADAVVESDETNNIDGPLPVAVGSSQPELLITAFTSSVSGMTVQYSVEVTNAGPVAAGIFSVDVYYDLLTPPTVGMAGDDSNLVASLASGVSTVINFSRTGTPTGTYDSYAFADSFDDVAESDEGNNVAGPEVVTVLTLADLVIIGLSSSVSGSDVTYTVSILNQGGTAAGAFDLDIYYDQPGAPLQGVGGDEAMVVVGLAAGAGTTVIFTRAGAPAGTFTSWAQVDTQDAIGESNETNNTAGPEVVMVGIAADLVILSFAASVAGTTVTYTMDVFNQGGTAAGPFDVDVYYDLPGAPSSGAPGDNSTSVSSLAPSASVPLVFTRTGTPVGTYDSWIQVDTLNAVVESNEANNVTGPEIVVISGMPDLIITAFGASVSGSAVTYSVTVMNQGTGAASAFDVDVYYDLPSAPSSGMSGDDDRSVLSLAAGMSANVTMTRSATPDGSYNSWAQVDAFNAVGESNENNNVDGPVSVSVGVGGPPDLVITSFTAQVVGSDVTYDIEVTNTGGTDVTTAFTVDLYYDLTVPPCPFQGGNEIDVITTLSAGASQIVTFTRIGTVTGTYDSYAQVDTFLGVVESDETNNVAGPLVVIVP